VVTRKRVLLDVDGVLRDWGRSARKIAFEFANVPKEYVQSDPTNYWWMEDLPPQFVSPCINALFEPGFSTLVLHRMAEPYLEAQKLYNFLKYNFNVTICSSQPNPFLETLTEQWLYKNIDNFDSNIVFTNEKHEVEGDIIVDDSPGMIGKILEHTKMNIYCVARPWNSEVVSENRVYRNTSEEIIKDMMEKYVPEKGM